ncbi:hypothetical protein ACET3X_001360 [Alternaria dauci]|uniref:Dehydrin n=1 Tax=Alternaria dauci TaxID=48095 RepID=A0ABR3UX34_9PLEO
MQKIKSVLHGHKKDDTVAHDAHTPSSTADGQQHPIYDQMSTGDEGRNTTAGHTGQPMYDIKTTSGAPYTELAQPSGSAGLHAHDVHGRPAHVGTDGPIGSTSTAATGAQFNPSRTQDHATTSQPLGSAGTTTQDEHRPNAYPHGHTQEPSVASIKSGVIGFGAGANQGHAAMPTHKPFQELSQDQVVGGGDPGTAGLNEGSGANPGQTHAQSGVIGSGPLGSSPAYTTECQPYESTLRQESYTADTDRSFPLAGGVITKPQEDSTFTRHQTEYTSSIHNKGISEREPGTKEKQAGIHNTESPVHDSYGREGLAGAAAAATAIGASKTLSHPAEKDVQDQGLETRQATYGDVPPATATATTQTGNVPSQSTSNYHPEALAAATVAASRSSDLPSSTQGHEHGAQGISPSGPTHSTIAAAPTTGMSSTDERPLNPRLESHRHVPGEYIATPSDEKTFLNYAPVIQPTSAGPSGNLSNIEPTSTLDPSHVQSTVEPTSTSEPHELRHTGTLEEPRPKSADGHNYGRNAAIAGGLGAGAVGLGAHAASRKHDTQDIGSTQPLYEESSPYSSKVLDPRVLGEKSRLEEQKFDEQRFDPQAKTEAAPSSGSTISGPPVTHDLSQTAGSQHHYGRDAALLGTGAAAAGGVHHALNRNDTPAVGTAVLPEGPSYTSATGSDVVALQPTSNFSKPLPTAGTSASQPVGHGDFYGAKGAPAPIPDTTTQQLSINPSQAPTATTVPEKRSEHHYGRDVGLAGAGAAAAGGLYAANRDNFNSGSASSTVEPMSEDPASRTIGPHDSNIANIIDPRVQPDPSKQKAHTTVGPHQSDTLNRLDPKVDEKTGQQGGHHYGRDAAVVGGAGAAGYGAYQATNVHGNQSMKQRALEAINAYGDHRMTQPEAAMPEQRYDPAATSARASNPVSSRTQYDYNDPVTQSNVNRTDPNDHVNRNAAFGGAGLAAAGLGAGAYAGSKHNGNTTQLPLRQKQDLAASGQSTHPVQGTTQSSYPMHEIATTASYPTSGTIAPHNTHAQDPTLQPYGARNSTNENNDKRNAAILGGAVGAAGLGGAAYANSQNQDDREAEERLKKIAHEREKEQHRLDKEQHKHDKEVHKHDKALAAHEKEEHRLAKEHEREQARLIKEQHQREKELEKENDGEEKKKGGLLGFLHRDKSKREKSSASPESSPRQSRDYSPRQSRDYSDDHPDSPRWKGKHLLHKDPPKGHPAREAMEQQQYQTNPYGSTGKKEHVGVDGPIGDPNMISGDRETRKGVYGAHPVSDLDHNNTVTEPHTGLPMNTERYGTGTGGTDGNPAIHGYHQHGVPGATSGQTATDWEAIKKADTPY